MSSSRPPRRSSPGNPHLNEVIVPRAPRAGGLRDDLALVRASAPSRYDLVIDFHGGPRSSLITWLSGAPRRIGYDVPGRGWMYTTRVRAAARASARVTPSTTSGICCARSASRRPTRRRSPVEMTVDPSAAGERRRRGSRPPASRADDRARRGARQRGQSVPALAARVVSRRSWRRLVRPDARPPRRRDLRTVGARRRRARHRAGARAAVARRARARARVRRVLARRAPRADGRAALYIGGDSGPLHIASTTRCRSSGSTARRCPSAPNRGAPPLVAERGRRGGRPAVPAVRSARCVPGDFRCLTRLPPEQVLDAAERVLAMRWPNRERDLRTVNREPCRNL